MAFDLIELPSEEKFLEHSASLLEEAVTTALSKSGRCVLGLSGGSTPLPIYELLKNRPIEWTNVWIYLTDERYVSPDHEASNQRAIRTALIDAIGLPPDHFLAPDTWKPLQECVHLYDQKLRELLAKGPADLVTMGLGSDGHIASLFPPVPPEAFEGAFALATHTENFEIPDRISATMPTLLASNAFLFFLKGIEKKKTWVKMQRGKRNPSRWPAQTLIETGNVRVVAQW